MDRVRDICKEKGVTLAELAERLQITYQTLHATLRGDARISSVRKIAAALGVEVGDLFAPPGVPGNFTCPRCGAQLKLSVEVQNEQGPPMGDPGASLFPA